MTDVSTAERVRSGPEVTLIRGERTAASTEELRHLAVVMDADSEPVRLLAQRLAGLLGADVSAICVVPPAPVGSLAQAEVRYDLAEAQERDQRARAQEASEAFDHALTEAGVAVAPRIVCREDAECTTSLLDVVRLSDLILIQQPEPGRERPADAHMDEVLLRSGRPCLLVPYAGVARLPFDVVTVAWDGSAPAARALGDAMPFLRQAKRVEVVQVARDFAPAGAETGARLMAHLEMHGIRASHRTLVTTLPFAEVMLSHLADTESDLLVMGAYGHSRLREALIGGASRDILRSMTVPVLMAH